MGITKVDIQAHDTYYVIDWFKLGTCLALLALAAVAGLWWLRHLAKSKIDGA